MTTIDNPADDRVQAIFLKMHLSLHAKGMKHSRMSGTRLLELTSRITGKSYKRGQYEQARNDIIEWQKMNV